mgnify:CR=1 FL=1
MSKVGDAMVANLADKVTKKRTATITVSVKVGDLALALGVVGATSVRIPAYGGSAERMMEFIFECAQEEPPA